MSSKIDMVAMLAAARKKKQGEIPTATQELPKSTSAPLVSTKVARHIAAAKSGPIRTIRLGLPEAAKKMLGIDLAKKGSEESVVASYPHATAPIAKPPKSIDFARLRAALDKSNKGDPKGEHSIKTVESPTTLPANTRARASRWRRSGRSW